MITWMLPAQMMDTRCYVMAAENSGECVVIDPGIGLAEPVRELLEREGMRPAAVLLTHGHLDHIWSVVPVCGGVAGAFVHGDDRYMVADPYAGLSPEFLAMLQAQFGSLDTWKEPESVVDLVDAQTLDLAGLSFTVTHAPGHTAGSVMFELEDVPDGLPADLDVTRTLVTGDVLFAGAIGRTDLPGGSAEAMRVSLATKVLTQPDNTLVLPGHGSATTIAAERATNPYLLDLA